MTSGPAPVSGPAPIAWEGHDNRPVSRQGRRMGDWSVKVCVTKHVSKEKFKSLSRITTPLVEIVSKIDPGLVSDPCRSGSGRIPELIRGLFPDRSGTRFGTESGLVSDPGVGSPSWAANDVRPDFRTVPPAQFHLRAVLYACWRRVCGAFLPNY